MAPTSTDALAVAAAQVQADGFAFVAGEAVREWLQGSHPLAGWQRFAASWSSLGPDPYLAERGRQRRRRHAVFAAGREGAVQLQSRQPHFQGLEYNPLQGDLERWFEPVLPDIADGAELRRILEAGRDFFGSLAPRTTTWHIEVHQFRIEPGADAPGEPTPEGVHRDGVDFVLVLMVDRHNIASGTTTIHADDGRELGSFTLSAAFDAAVVDDRRVFHGVTPVESLEPGLPSHRDVLVVTYLAGAAGLVREPVAPR